MDGSPRFAVGVQQYEGQAVAEDVAGLALLVGAGVMIHGSADGSRLS
jgi:hypothetical protein